MNKQLWRLAIGILGCGWLLAATAGAECTVDLIGTADTPSTVVATIGSLAAVSSGGTTATLVDLATTTPEPLGLATASFPIVDLALGRQTVTVVDDQGNPSQKSVEMLFVVSSSSGGRLLEVFNLEDRDAPTLAGTATLFAPPRSVVHDDEKGVLWVGEGAEAPGGASGILEIFTLSDENGAPTKAGQYATTAGGGGVSTRIEGITRMGQTLILALGDGGFELADVLNATSPQILSYRPVAGGVWDVSVGAVSTHFFASGGASGWYVVDIVDRASPSIAVTTPGAVSGLSARGSYVVVGRGAAGFEIFDVSDLNSPILVQHQDTPGSALEVHYPGVVAGVSMVLVADGEAGLGAYDVGYCLCSRETGRLTPAVKTTRFVVNGTSTYAIDGVSKFFVVDYSSKAPVKRGEVVLGGVPVSLATLFPARNAYVAVNAGGAGKIQVVDASDTLSPVISASLDLPMVPTAVAYAKGYLFVGGAAPGSSTDGIIRIYAASNPTSMTFVSEIPLTSSGVTTVVRDFAFDGDLLFVAADAGGLLVFDISTPTQTGLLGSYRSTAGAIRAVSGNQQAVHVVVGSSTLETIDVGVPNAPEKIASHTEAATVTRIYAFLGRLAVGLGSSGFVLYDVFDPADFDFIESLDTDGSVVDLVQVITGPSGALLALAIDDAGVASIEISSCIRAGKSPTASFAVDPDPPAAGAAAHFVDTSRNKPTSWAWTFGDGGSSTEQNPSHVYASAGVYSVTLTASNIIGTSAATRTVFVSGSTGTPDSGYASRFYIPAAAAAPGVNNTLWSTDVAIFNRSGSEAQVLLSFLPANKDNSTAIPTSLVVVAPNQTIALDQIVATTFGQANAAGGIQLASSVDNLVAVSRTYNTGGGAGTYGQFIPAFAAAAGLRGGQTGHLIQLSSNAGFRTNIGFVNGSTANSSVEVRLIDGAGTILATVPFSLRPFEYLQRTKIFESAGLTGEIANARAEVRVLVGAGPVFAYASVVDNVSGDAVFQLATR